MAEIDGCMACDAARNTTWMITHLNPPATVQSCEQDIDINLIGVLATRHGLDAGWLYEQIAKVIDRQVKKAMDRMEKEAAEAEAAPEDLAEEIIEDAAEVHDALSEG